MFKGFEPCDWFC